MKKYINPTINIVTVECSTLMSISVKDGFACDDNDVLVKEEDLTEEDLYKIFLGWDF